MISKIRAQCLDGSGRMGVLHSESHLSFLNNLRPGCSYCEKQTDQIDQLDDVGHRVF